MHFKTLLRPSHLCCLHLWAVLRPVLGYAVGCRVPPRALLSRAMSKWMRATGTRYCSPCRSVMLPAAAHPLAQAANGGTALSQALVASCHLLALVWNAVDSVIVAKNLRVRRQTRLLSVSWGVTSPLPLSRSFLPTYLPPPPLLPPFFLPSPPLACL